MKTEDLIERVDYLIEKANETLRSEDNVKKVDQKLFYEFRSSSLSFLDKLLGSHHSYYQEFYTQVKNDFSKYTESGKGILLAVKTEIENGWLFQIKDFISAEIFADFLEMAEYLLDEKYKDAAAVMIGSVLEEHLRQLCDKNAIPTFITDAKGKSKPKKADLLNSELSNASIYNKLDQKNITAWLDLRNKAAHGEYKEYNKEQVESMYRGISEFIGRQNI